MRIPPRLLGVLLRLTEKRYLAREASVPRARARMLRRTRHLSMPPGSWTRNETIAGRPALRVMSGPTASDRLILFLHGGAFIMGSPATHQTLAAALSARCAVPVLLPDYRLAPENPFPAGLDDCVDVYRSLREAGLASSRIVLAGDSAGGALALGLLQRIAAEGLGQPAGTVLFSPVTDLTFSGETIRTNAETEVMLPGNRLDDLRDWYVGRSDPGDPLVSPLFGSYVGAGPVLLQASLSEMLLDDTLRVANRLLADGVTTKIMTWPGMPHVWQLFQGHLSAADAALDAAAGFIGQCLPHS